MTTEDELNLLVNPHYQKQGLLVYKAGHFTSSTENGYPGFFIRDHVTSAIISQDPRFLKDSLKVAHANMARAQNPLDGAEKWKTAHEIPGVKLKNGLFTTYNASDSVAYFLLGHGLYQRLTRNSELIKTQHKEIIATHLYIENHLNHNHQFYEDPKFAGCEKFALKRTDWRDSETPNRENGEVKYPVVYPLVQALYIRALQESSCFCNLPLYAKLAKQMTNGLIDLYDPETQNFVLAQDQIGRVTGISSDSLSIWCYLNSKDLDPQLFFNVVESSKNIETDIGYRGLEPKLAELTKDEYHSGVWPKVQGEIYRAGEKMKKWALKDQNSKILEAANHTLEVSSRITDVIKDSSPEHFRVLPTGEGFQKSGCETQLWTVATKMMFAQASLGRKW